MTEVIGSNSSRGDEVTQVDSYVLNSATAIIIAVTNERRLFFHVDNNFSDKAAWVRLYPAAQDNIKRGIFINGKEQGRTDWEMPPGSIYTGEISAIAEEGVPTIYVTEY